MTKKIELPFSLLTYDIETRLKQFHAFSCGETVLRHSSLTNRSVHQHNIICIAAKWYDKKEVMLFHGENAIEEFDAEARKADVCMGKNNMKFDVKYINTERMLRGLKPYPEWLDSAEDLEQQLRKYFNFTSQSLDFISKLFGNGGKVKMEFDDWVAISNYEVLTEFQTAKKHTNLKVLEDFCQVLFRDTYNNVIKLGKRALTKMYFYNKKDVVDTELALIKVLPYIKLKHNGGTGNGCTTCGSTLLVPTKIITKGQTKYQQFDCLGHDGYAGRATFRWDKHRHKVYGKIS